MQIIPPHKKASQEVENWSQIKDAVNELEAMVDTPFGIGLWKEAFALSHCQVSDMPFKFFSVAKAIEPGFGHKTIINLRIINKEEPVSFKEGCMSFPFRPLKNTKRFNRIYVEYAYKGFFGLKTERCFLTGIHAFIAQHEYDHALGTNIYAKF